MNVYIKETGDIYTLFLYHPVRGECIELFCKSLTKKIGATPAFYKLSEDEASEFGAEYLMTENVYSMIYSVVNHIQEKYDDMYKKDGVVNISDGIQQT